MAELLPQLRDALEGKYAVLREVGAGGMAQVFLATDLKHSRQVAVKVIRPDVERAQGGARFAREIAIEANLQHPHIVPLYDSGEAAGFLYYVMPYVEGESLRERIRREGQLAVDDALRIATQVASALDHAHRAGVVHRDIKPENILLPGGEALVTDFGIARAASVPGEQRLTATGVALGTPAYMAPEQATGSERVDPRTDIYALGCVLYEMLAGEPPFTGPTAQAVLARQSMGAVPSLRVVRPKVPRYVEAAVLTALEKVPADRFRTATAFAEALERPPLRFRIPWVGSVRWWAAAAVAVVAVAAVAWALGVRIGQSGGARGGHLDPGLIAVAPFQVSGTVDRSLVTPEALEELVYTRLYGEGGIRALYPGAVTAAWRRAARAPSEAMTMRDAVRAAADLGAGRLLWGSVYGTAARLAFSASMVDVATGNLVGDVEEVAGPPDSVLRLLDRLAAGILLSTAGELGRDLSVLTTEDLAALRVYLAGWEGYRRGRYAEAAARFGEARRKDSTFVLAAMAQLQAQAMLGEDQFAGDALAFAWSQRHRLSGRDTLFLRALVGRRYPRATPALEVLRVWERVGEDDPGRWEASYYLGSVLLRKGPALGIPDWRQRAAAAIRRALDVDSLFAPALEDMIALSLAGDDTAQARQYGTRYLSAHPTSERAGFVRWQLGVGVGDERILAGERQRLRREASVPLSLVLASAQIEGAGLEDAAVAAAELRARARGAIEVLMTDWAMRDLQLNRGRPSEAPYATGEGRLDVPLTPFQRIVDAIFWDGDSAAAGEAARAETGQADRSRAATLDDHGPFMALCAVSLWQVSHGDLRLAREAVGRLRGQRLADADGSTMYIPICAGVLEARVAAADRRPDAGATLDRLDSLLRTGPVTNPHVLLAANITAARLYEARGDRARALAAARRHAYSFDAWGTTGLSTYLREEGRLAALTGDTASAIAAYRHYLALRSDPEPRLVPDAARVRSELDALMRTWSGAPERARSPGS